MYYFSGIGDEAANGIDDQIRAIKALGWENLEARNVEVPGFPKGNIHDIPDAAFDLLVEKVQAAGIRMNSTAKRVKVPSTHRKVAPGLVVVVAGEDMEISLRRWRTPTDGGRGRDRDCSG